MDGVPGLVREHFGIELASVRSVRGGEDSSAVLWRAEATDGAAYAVKLSGRGLAAGLTVAAYLAGQGLPGVPAPLPARSGQPWAAVEGGELAVLPWLAGRRAVDGGLDAGQWRSFGALLAGLHAVPVPAGVAARLPVEDHVTAEVAVLRAMDEWARGGDGPADPVAATLRDCWPAADVAVLLERTDGLAARLRGRPMRTVLCHADAHTANLLVGTDGRLWLIDWDGALLAPRERDLMFVLGGVLADALVSPAEQDEFFAGYGPVRVDPTRLAYYRCSWAVQDLGDFAHRIVVGDRPDEDRATALRFFQSLLWPTGIVALARSALATVDPRIATAGS